MAVARGAWALLAMQTTCYTAHIEKKANQTKNIISGRTKMKTKNKTHITNVILMWCTGIKPL